MATDPRPAHVPSTGNPPVPAAVEPSAPAADSERGGDAFADAQLNLAVAVDESVDGEGSFDEPEDVPVQSGHAVAELARVDAAAEDRAALQAAADAFYAEQPVVGENVHNRSFEDRALGTGGQA
jgi:hypothetical protein